MKLRTVALRVSGTLALVGSLVHAQTVQNGPYYAKPSWDQKLQCDTPSTCGRFVVLANWSSQAVLDLETGLVWERSPGSILTIWDRASSYCIGRSVGGRFGWRLPSIQELNSLIDPIASAATLPAGHPFIGVHRYYWSATSNVNDSSRAWYVTFVAVSPDHTTKTRTVLNVLCVHDGPGLDAQ